MAVALMSVTSVHQGAFASESGMTVTATAAEGGNIISVSGLTTSNAADIIVRVIAPNGNLISVDQITPDSNGDFATDISVGGPLWSQDGMYKIIAKQGPTTYYTLTVYVDVTSGMTAETSTTQSGIVSTQTSGDDSGFGPSIENIAGLSIEADAIEGSDTIGITGQTSKTNEDVTFTVTAPNGNRVGIDQVTPGSNGDFATDISVGGPLWSQDGMYTVTAVQGSGSAFTDSVQVDIADGLVVPEFGTIAAMILAVAIISIIAISAKSRLSIVPRY